MTTEAGSLRWEEDEALLSAPDFQTAQPLLSLVPTAPETETIVSHPVELARIKRVRTNEGLFVQLVAEHQRLIRGIARQYFLAGGEAQDLEQEALIGFYKAVRDYNGSSPFNSFAELCIRRQTITAIKTATRSKHGVLNNAVSFEHAPGEEDDDLTLGNIIPAKEPTIQETIESSDELRRLVDLIKMDLTELEFDVLRLYLSDYSYADMATQLGVNQKSVDNAFSRVKRKILGHEERRQKEVNEELATAGLRYKARQDWRDSGDMFVGFEKGSKVEKAGQPVELQVGNTEALKPESRLVDPLAVALQALAKLREAGLPTTSVSYRNYLLSQPA